MVEGGDKGAGLQACKGRCHQRAAALCSGPGPKEPRRTCAGVEWRKEETTFLRGGRASQKMVS